MNFEWDENKNISNHKKHTIWFEEAQTVWADPHSMEFFDLEHDISEERFIRIGHSSRSRLLLVIFCERSKKKDNSIRIISARKATTKERANYEKGI